MELSEMTKEELIEHIKWLEKEVDREMAEKHRFAKQVRELQDRIRNEISVPDAAGKAE